VVNAAAVLMSERREPSVSSFASFGMMLVEAFDDSDISFGMMLVANT
jgi:hypothetical protein